MVPDECVYPGCTNPKNSKALYRTESSVLPWLVEVERSGELDFPDPPYYPNAEICVECRDRRALGGRTSFGAAGHGEDAEVIEQWRRDLRGLAAKSGQSPQDLAELHGYQNRVRRLIRKKAT